MTDQLIDRPSTWGTAGDHERRVRALEALQPCCGNSGGGFDTFRECVLANPATVLFWPCDEPSGNLTDLVESALLVPTTADVSGTTYPLYGQPGPFTALPAETAVEFAGVSGIPPADEDRFTGSLATISALFSGLNPWTIDMWLEQIAFPSGPFGGRLLEIWNGTVGEALLINASNTTGYLSVTRRNVGIGGTIAEEAPLGEYVYLRVTYDGTDLTMFINQVETATAGAATSFTSTPVITIGNTANTGGTGWSPFNGRIADIAIYDSALTEFCDISPDGGGNNASAGMVLTADGSGGTYWAFPTITVEY